MLSASAAAAAGDLEKTSGSEGACSLKGFDEGLFRIFLCVKHCKCRSVLSLSSFSVFDCNQLMNLLVTWLSCPGLEVFGHIIHTFLNISDISDSPLNFLDDCAETEAFEVLTVSKVLTV